MARTLASVCVVPIRHILIASLSSTGSGVAVTEIQGHDADQTDADERAGESCPDSGL